MDEITGVSELLQVADAIGESRFWRGHGAAGWKLQSSIHRDGGYDRYYERNLVHHFLTGAPVRRQPGPEMTDYPGWLLLMQHYGLPTRLLDWTESPLIAAYFAVWERGRWAEDGAVWALSAEALNRSQGMKVGSIAVAHDPNVRPHFAPPFDDKVPEPDTVLALAPTQIDLRLTVQQSLFTLHSKGDPLEEMAGDALRKLLVPRAAKAKLHHQLDLLGVNRATLFPDLANLAQYLKETFPPTRAGPAG